MSLRDEYRRARQDEELARLRRLVALRAMRARGMTQREIAAELGVSQPAVSQQLAGDVALRGVDPERLLAAAGPVIKSLAEELGYSRLGVFGSVARHEARQDSDIDLIVQAPEGTSSFAFVGFASMLEEVLGREIDLVEYGGLAPGLDADILAETVPL